MQGAPPEWDTSVICRDQKDSGAYLCGTLIPTLYFKYNIYAE